MERTRPGEPAHLVLEVPDIHCAGCEQSIEDVLRNREGVGDIKADSRAHKVRVAYWPEQIGLHQIEEAVTSLGFRVQRTHVAGHDETVA